MKTFSIYALKEPDTGEIRYFGKTCQPIVDRLTAHLNAKPNWHVSRWVQALKRDNKAPVCEVLMLGLRDREACEEEVALISWGRNKGLRLTNLTDGGDGRKGFSPSEETRKKISDFHKGRVVSLETREKLRLANLGKVLSKKHKNNIRDGVPRGEDHFLFGKSPSEETRRKISQTLSGRKQSTEQIANRVAALPKGDKHWTRRRDTVEARQKMIEARRKSSESHKIWWAAKKKQLT